MKKILILTRFDTQGASSRYRFYQFIPYLKKNNFDVNISYLLSNNYLGYIYNGKKLKKNISILISYIKRIIILFKVKNYDLIWVEKENFPWIPFCIENYFINKFPTYVIDFDDPIFHTYDQYPNKFLRKIYKNKISKIMQSSNLVVAGNYYISNYAKRNGVKNVKVIPTVVNHEKYLSKSDNNHHPKFTIGWIGSPSTARHIQVAKEALIKICSDSNVQFLVIGANSSDLNDIPAKIIPWLEETENSNLSKFDVGIMPLPDTPWERGKCGFKIIQYMASSIPVIASPVGINNHIVDHGINGFLAKDSSEWIKYIEILKNDSELRISMGLAGQKKVKEKYSLSNIAPKISMLLEKIR